MRFAIVFTLLSHGGPPGDAWLGPDKVKHFFTSAFVQSVSYGALRAARVREEPAVVGATAATLSAGLGKELHDRRAYGRFSLRDLVWDAAGAGAATVALVRTR